MEEIEAFLQKEDFYGQCTEREGSLLTQEVREVDGKCFEDRRCSSEVGTLRDESKEFFVGFREEDDCTCSNEDIGIPQNNLSLASKRYKRFINNNAFQSSNTVGVVAFPLIPGATPSVAFDKVTKTVANSLPVAQTEGKKIVKQDDEAAIDNTLGEGTVTGKNTY